MPEFFHDWRRKLGCVTDVRRRRVIRIRYALAQQPSNRRDETLSPRNTSHTRQSFTTQTDLRMANSTLNEVSGSNCGIRLFDRTSFPVHAAIKFEKRATTRVIVFRLGTSSCTAFCILGSSGAEFSCRLRWFQCASRCTEVCNRNRAVPEVTRTTVARPVFVVESSSLVSRFPVWQGYV